MNRLSDDELKSLKARLQDVIKDAETSSRCNVRQVGSRKIFKRPNKDRPVEITSKVPISMHRKTKITRRDPRFEQSCGPFDAERFKKRYSFLYELEEKEQKIITRKMNREKDPQKRMELKKVVQSLKGKKVTEQERERKIRIAERLRQEAVKKTGKPFVNKSYLKKFALVDKFQQLKKAGKLDKYIERKRKKLVVNARKKYDI